MPEELPQYADVVSEIELLLDGWTGKLIAIDGRPYAGKSNLARFLAWRFGVPAIHTDLFLKPGQGKVDYRYRNLDCVLRSRLGRESPVPVIVEGVAVLRLLNRLSLQPDYLVHISGLQQADCSGGANLEADLDAYELEFSPKERANRIIEIDPPRL